MEERWNATDGAARGKARLQFETPLTSGGGYLDDLEIVVANYQTNIRHCVELAGDAPRKSDMDRLNSRTDPG